MVGYLLLFLFWGTTNWQPPPIHPQKGTQSQKKTFILSNFPFLNCKSVKKHDFFAPLRGVQILKVQRSGMTSQISFFQKCFEIIISVAKWFRKLLLHVLRSSPNDFWSNTWSRELLCKPFPCWIFLAISIGFPSFSIKNSGFRNSKSKFQFFGQKKKHCDRKKF